MREGVGKVKTCFLGPPGNVAAGEVKMQRWERSYQGRYPRHHQNSSQISVTGFPKKKRHLGEGRHRCLPFVPTSMQSLQWPKEKRVLFLIFFFLIYMICILQQPCALWEILAPRVWVSRVDTDPGAAGGSHCTVLPERDHFSSTARMHQPKPCSGPPGTQSTSLVPSLLWCLWTWTNHFCFYFLAVNQR